MAIWLLKTEHYSYNDLERDGKTMWDDVTQAHSLIHLRKIKKGDTALIYHSGRGCAIIGIADVTRGAYVNPEADDPKLAICDVRVKERLKRPVTLAQIKAHPQSQNWDLVRLGRLSVVPVSEEQWQILQAMMEGQRDEIC